MGLCSGRNRQVASSDQEARSISLSLNDERHSLRSSRPEAKAGLTPSSAQPGLRGLAGSFPARRSMRACYSGDQPAANGQNHTGYYFERPANPEEARKLRDNAGSAEDHWLSSGALFQRPQTPETPQVDIKWARLHQNQPRHPPHVPVAPRCSALASQRVARSVGYHPVPNLYRLVFTSFWLVSAAISETALTNAEQSHRECCHLSLGTTKWLQIESPAQSNSLTLPRDELCDQERLLDRLGLCLMCVQCICVFAAASAA
jgi:hypothetical protein